MADIQHSEGRVQSPAVEIVRTVCEVDLLVDRSTYTGGLPFGVQVGFEVLPLRRPPTIADRQAEEFSETDLQSVRDSLADPAPRISLEDLGGLFGLR